MQSPYHIARGEFTSCNSQAQLLLERDETCLAVVKGCEIADVAAISVGVASDAHKASASAGAGGSSAESESDGWNDVEEGPKVQPKAGFLHVTTRRICFVGTFKEKTIPLSAVVEVHFANNILEIIAAEGQSTSYSLPEFPLGLQTVAAIITKLTELAQEKRRPKVRAERVKMPTWN